MNPATQPSAPKAEEVRTQRQVFDLVTMQPVTLHKITPFEPVSGSLVDAVGQALKRLDDKESLVINALNEGLIAELRRRVVSDASIPWLEETDDSKFAEYKGTPVTPEGQALLNQLVLTLAKTMFGYPSEIDDTRMKPEEVEQARKMRVIAKDKALNFVRDHKELLEGIRETSNT